MYFKSFEELYVQVSTACSGISKESMHTQFNRGKKGKNKLTKVIGKKIQ